MTDLKEYWRGGVEQWECDSMGHMNVRFWMRRFYDSLAVFCHELGLHACFHPQSPLAPAMRQAHLKFIKEAHVGAPLYLIGGPTNIEQNCLYYYAEIRHSVSQEVAATLNAKIEFLKSQLRDITPLPTSVQRVATEGKIIIPEHGIPRSIDLATKLPNGDLEWATLKGFSRIGLMVVRQEHCDCFGYLLPEMFFGFISESVPNFASLRHAIKPARGAPVAPKPPRLGGAVLENRFDYLDLPKIGDILEIRSGIVGLGDKTRTLQHRIFNATTGAPVCISHAIVVSFDLDTRKAVSIPPEMRAQIAAGMIEI